MHLLAVSGAYSPNSKLLANPHFVGQRLGYDPPYLPDSSIPCGAGGRPWRFDANVPEISRFFGIVIRMFVEVGAPHHTPHFHAYYQDNVGIFAIDPIELLAGGLPQRQRRLVEGGRDCIKVN